MKVLISGDKGYIGSNLSDFLAKMGVEIVGYDMKDGFDILDKENLIKQMKGCKIAYHCAAVSSMKACDENRLLAYAVNIKGTENFVNAAYINDCKPVLFSSFGSTKLHYYGTLKRLTEYLFEKDAVVLRLSNVYGGIGYLEKKGNNFIAHLAKDNPIKVFDKQEKKNFVHISTVLEWCVRAFQLDYGIYNVCSPDEVHLETVAQIVGTVRNVKVEIAQG